MRLEYPTPHDYWQKVANNPTGRLFVPTTHRHHIGERLQLELSINGYPGCAQLMGVVVGRRQRLGRLPDGVFLRLAPAEVEKARALLGIGAAVPEFERLRSAPRFRCSLPMRFVRPELPGSSMVMNLSEGGLLANQGKGVMEGEQVEVAVELPGGPLQLEAEVEWRMGSCVGLRFVRLPAEALGLLREHLAHLSRQDSAARTPKNAPVLVVADCDVEACNQLSSMLAEQGARPLTVQDGRELVSLCRAVLPDLVFVDVLLEGIDGTQACRQLRSEQEVGDIPLVLTAPFSPAELERLAWEDGANDYLVKPATSEEVAQLLHRLFGLVSPEVPSLRM